MREVLRSNDPIRISWVVAVLEDCGITAIVLDNHMSILDGSICAIPRRIMVAEADWITAGRQIGRALAALDPPESFELPPA